MSGLGYREVTGTRGGTKFRWHGYDFIVPKAALENGSREDVIAYYFVSAVDKDCRKKGIDFNARIEQLFSAKNDA